MQKNLIKMCSVEYNTDIQRKRDQAKVHMRCSHYKYVGGFFLNNSDPDTAEDFHTDIGIC